MNTDNIIQKIIDEAWEVRNSISAKDKELSKSIKDIINLLDQGKLRVAEKVDGEWTVHEWIKKVILLSFRVSISAPINGYPESFDKVPLKFSHWQPEQFNAMGIRVVPGSIARYGAYIGRNVILMPSFVNIGAYVDEGTMIDTWATIGSCAQIGKYCHISGGAGIGGVLEPVQASPVIIEDHCFIGARSEIVEGVRVEEGAVIGMGVFIASSTPIVNRVTGEVIYGRVPPYSVVISGTQPSKSGPHMPCAIIIKQVDEKTRAKTSVNELLRA